MITTAFTCTGSYAILIMLGIKRVENRSMRPIPNSGRCAISCSKSFCKEEYGEFVRWASLTLTSEDFARIPSWADVCEWAGCIIGCVDYECQEKHTGFVNPLHEKWNEGYRYWWEFTNIVCFDMPIGCRGNVGMWKLPDALANVVTHADHAASSEDVEIITAKDAARLFHIATPIVGSSEGFWVLPLDVNRHTLSAPILVSLGLESNTATVRPRDIFSEALRLNAISIIVAHNHPGGTLAPSSEDIRLTKKLKQLSAALEIKFLDHIILGHSGTWLSIIKYC